MEKNNDNERWPEYLDNMEYVLEIAEEILKRIGWYSTDAASSRYPIRIAQWPRKPKQLHFRLERYRDDLDNKRYTLSMYMKGELFNGIAIEIRQHNIPVLYQLDDDGTEHEVGDKQAVEMRDQLLTVLTNADNEAFAYAERRAIDRQFERAVGNYILSSLAIRPLDSEDTTITVQKSKEMTYAFQQRTAIIEQEELRNSRGKKSVERAINNKPNPLTNSRFIAVDPLLSTAIAASQLNGEWLNTIDITKAPSERIPKAT